MHPLLVLAGLIGVTLAINIPLGYLRQNHEKFTFPWFFYVHISIPLIIYLRVKSGFSWKMIPLTIGGAFAGQLVGGIINRRRNGKLQREKD